MAEGNAPIAEMLRELADNCRSSADELDQLLAQYQQSGNDTDLVSSLSSLLHKHQRSANLKLHMISQKAQEKLK